jgi:hypothetical protein
MEQANQTIAKASGQARRDLVYSFRQRFGLDWIQFQGLQKKMFGESFAGWMVDHAPLFGRLPDANRSGNPVTAVRAGGLATLTLGAIVAGAITWAAIGLGLLAGLPAVLFGAGLFAGAALLSLPMLIQARKLAFRIDPESAVLESLLQWAEKGNALALQLLKDESFKESLSHLQVPGTRSISRYYRHTSVARTLEIFRTNIAFQIQNDAALEAKARDLLRVLSLLDFDLSMNIQKVGNLSIQLTPTPGAIYTVDQDERISRELRQLLGMLPALSINNMNLAPPVLRKPVAIGGAA